MQTPRPDQAARTALSILNKALAACKRTGADKSPDEMLYRHRRVAKSEVRFVLRLSCSADVGP
ncbi:hypothetical protein XFF6990_140203 [Xanthomonas citri pv. fuscans]|uniref:Uncharacterized protein n=1 Tax=Xanthomonas campestris pv. phaseoli TaxID=317013 RepID=A0A7Z7IWP4_XANCH|nr:hypothetical protein XFF6990_140203 [Xanthomonas citri pv. fuscans]SOO22134.1 hypothetical protein XFF6991_120001 [Xanthomonas phaseoli pv. phaseoli]